EINSVDPARLQNIVAIFVILGLVRATVLTVGLIRFRYIYYLNKTTLLVVTILVGFGIATIIFAGGISAVILSTIGAKILSEINILVGITTIYNSAMDVLLSILFTKALIKGLNMSAVAKKDLIFISDAKRLALSSLISALVGITQATSGIMQHFDKINAAKIAQQTDWANYVPAWLYIFGSSQKNEASRSANETHFEVISKEPTYQPNFNLREDPDFLELPDIRHGNHNVLGSSNGKFAQPEYNLSFGPGGFSQNHRKF
ncbi:hypothetical protein HK096_000116, partial [Nowakowskiella sp. JEL0078]